MSDSIWIMLCFMASAGSFAVLQRVAMRGKGDFSRAGDVLACLTGLYVACFFLLLTARPFMAFLLGISLFSLLVVLNRAKEIALHEPLVLADTYLLRQIFKYPHLYFPFLPMKGIAAGFFVVCLALGALVYIESPLPTLRSVGAILSLGSVSVLLPLCLYAVSIGCFHSLGAFLLRVFPPSSDAAADAVRNGLLAVVVVHPAWMGMLKHIPPDFLRNSSVRPAASRFPESLEQALVHIDAAKPDALPHIVLIQAESFYDIRKHVAEPLKSQLANFLPNWDKLEEQGRAFDPPEHAYGAYTMRTEFSMLTGLHAADMGPWAYNPYLLAARQPLWSLARHLDAKGYDTVCIHPYHKDFFSRDTVMPLLGFKRFLSIESLDHLEKFGPYISDLALGNEIQKMLATSDKPVFCFAITMEAHGPWLPGRLTEEEIASTLADIDTEGLSLQLRQYLCHLRHMDAMFGVLHEKAGQGRGWHVWAYGDHAPGIVV